MKFDLIKKVHIIGIEGAGTSALARILKDRGIEVSGSDEGDHFYYDILEQKDIKVKHGFSPKNLPTDADLIVYSTAYKKESNPELAAALGSRCPVMSYPEALALLFREKFGISVCGTHGKTTTTAWLGYVLDRAGLSPTVLVGSKVGQFRGNVLAGGSDYFVAETDEYQDKLRHYDPRAVILNNIEYDHPDFFPDEKSYLAVFIEFIKRIPKNGFLVANYDDPNIRKIAAVNCRCRVASYAVNEAAGYVAHNIRFDGGKQIFSVKISPDAFDDDDSAADTDLGEFSISLFGRHNVYNALAVIVASIELGLDLSVIRTHLESFLGTARRLEEMGKYRGAVLIDDYAHHPTEIRASLEAVGQKYPGKRIIAVFQPHTYTRTRALLDDFARSFTAADELVLLDIYGSAREKQGGVHSLDLMEKIKSENKQVKISHIKSQSECADHLRGRIGGNDAVVLMGAGDVYEIGKKILG